MHLIFSILIILKEYSYKPPILTFDSSMETIEEELIQSPGELIPENNLEPKTTEINSNKVQKSVNYFNHKFVISDTEDISVETLISRQQPQIYNSKKRKIEPKIEIKPKTKESLLKTDLDNEKFKKNYQNKIFIIKHGQMIPILSPIVINSGIFRSKNNLTKKALEEFVEIKPRENVVYTNTIKGKILTLKNFEKQIKKTTIVSIKQTPKTSHLGKLCERTVNLSETEIKPQIIPPNTNIIYRIVAPEDVNLKKDDSSNQETPQIMDTSERQKIKPKIRPTKRLKKKFEQISIPAPPLQPVQPTARTRSGRLSRPPRYIQNYDLQKSEEDEKEIISNFPINTISDLVKETPVINTLETKVHRNLNPEHKCGTCNKLYLGKTRMVKHLENFPSHGDKSAVLARLKETPKTLTKNSLYDFFIKKIKATPITDRSKLFIAELSNFVKSIEELVPHILKENPQGSIDFVDKNSSKILGIPCGDYQLDLTFETNLKTDEDLINSSNNRLDYLNISEDADKTNLSDESLLRSVDELVKERWKNIGDDEEVDPFINNTVDDKSITPTPILDLSLDYLLS